MLLLVFLTLSTICTQINGKNRAVRAETALSDYGELVNGYCDQLEGLSWILDTDTEACAAACNANEACVEIAFTSIYKLCYLYDSGCDNPAASDYVISYSKKTAKIANNPVDEGSQMNITASNVHDSNRPLTLAIDGNLGNNGLKECSVVKAAEGSDDVWIQLDLGQVVNITAVELLPRKGRGKQLANFQVYVGSPVDQLDDSMLCKSYDGKVPTNGNIQRLDCDTVLSGRYVTLKKTAGSKLFKYLTVCEIKVVSA